MNFTFKLITYPLIALLIISCRVQKSSDQNSAGRIVQYLDDNIMVVHQDREGNYWFGSWDSGLYQYDGVTLTQYDTSDGLPSHRIDGIQEDDAGNIYISTCHPRSYVCKYDGKTFMTLTASPSHEWRLQAEDIWFRHAFGEEKVYRYDGSTLHELRVPPPPHLSNPFEIYSIYRDSRGNIWFGTNPVGACRYDGASFDWITEEDVTEFRDEGANGVRSIVEDRKGDFWFNTEFRYSIYDSLTLQSEKFYTRHSSIGGLDGKTDSHLDEYLSATRDDDDHLWFVSYLDGIWKYDGTKVKHYPIIEDSTSISLFSIYKDSKGLLWVGTHDHGVYICDDAGCKKFQP